MLTAAGWAVPLMLPIIARKHFGAGDWQTLLLTVAIPACLLLSIFWNELLSRCSTPRYLALQWCCAFLPLALIAFAQHYVMLLICHVVAAAGHAGWPPIFGALLKRFYPDHTHGRGYSILTAAQLLSVMLTTLGIGHALEADAEAFRWFLPLIAGLQAVGMLLLIWLARRNPPADPPPAVVPLRVGAALRAVVHMRSVLRADQPFRRYEQAFMTYGFGYMICEALLPVLVTTGLHLSYEQIAGAALAAARFGMLAMVLPMGWLLDRIGPTRTSAISFAVLAVYPIGLLAANGTLGVGLASGVYGVAMAGVMSGWMIGPVAFARTAAQVPQYVAIHTTLVGFRGIVAQGLGMLLYGLTGGFFWPLLAAAAAFAWAGLQMWRLHGTIRAAAVANRETAGV